MHLGPHKGELLLIEDEECVDPGQDEDGKKRHLGDEDNVPDPDWLHPDMTVVDIPDDPDDDNGEPCDLHGYQYNDGRPPSGLLHGYSSYHCGTISSNEKSPDQIISPVSELGFARLIFTRTIFPRMDISPSKFTMVFWVVLP